MLSYARSEVGHKKGIQDNSLLEYHHGRNCVDAENQVPSISHVTGDSATIQVTQWGRV